MTNSLLFLTISGPTAPNLGGGVNPLPSWKDQPFLQVPTIGINKKNPPYLCPGRKGWEFLPSFRVTCYIEWKSMRNMRPKYRILYSVTITPILWKFWPLVTTNYGDLRPLNLMWRHGHTTYTCMSVPSEPRRFFSSDYAAHNSVLYIMAKIFVMIT